MKNYFNYNFEKQTIVGTKSAIARANKGMEPEFSQLCAMLEKCPNFKVVAKEINHKKERKTYKHLSIKLMQEYISTLDDCDKKLIEFKAIVKMADAKGAKYPLTKKWFLKNYPEFKNSELFATETAKAEAKAEIEEAKKAEAEAQEKARKALELLEADDDEEEYEEEFDDVANS